MAAARFKGCDRAAASSMRGGYIGARYEVGGVGSGAICGGSTQHGQHAKTRRGGGGISDVGSVHAGHKLRKEMTLTRGPNMSAREESTGGCAGVGRGEKEAAAWLDRSKSRAREREGRAERLKSRRGTSRPKM